jgi:hypothetical protein
VVRLNTERGPDWSLELHPGRRWELRRGQRNLTSGTCPGVWWRRPEVPASDGGDPAQEAIDDQWRAFLSGLASVPGPVWLSDPAAIRAAENKAVQLRAAAEVGLRVPDTLWTTNVDEASAFIERWKNTAVVKSVATAWWEAEGDSKFVFAQRISTTDLPPKERLASAPVCFQQAISPKQDVRVTVIGETVLAAARTPDPQRDGEHVDWRQAGQGDWSGYNLPASVARRCRALVQELGLLFGGLDLVVDGDNRHWFLELNANGEWGWLQRSGLPIAESVADVLLQVKRTRRIRIPAGTQSVLLSEGVWIMFPTAATWYLNRQRVREPRTMPSVPPAGWTRSARKTLLSDSEGRLRNLEAKGPGLATITAVVVAGVIAAIVTGWSASDGLGRAVLALAAFYVFLSLLVPLKLVGPLRRNVIDVDDILDASDAREPEEALAERAAEAAMATDVENLRVGNLLDAARRELFYVVALLAAWLLLVPATGLLKHDDHHHDPGTSHAASQLPSPHRQSRT